MTERLYYHDSYLKEFKAQILKKIKVNNQFAVMLDKTAFYPTSGGQPYDTGTIQNVEVIDVIEENNEIIHILKDKLKEENGTIINGKINWERRFDHMQQHTGQHILSGALMKLWEAETVSFHLGEKLCTLDIVKDNLTSGEAYQVEELANRIIFEDRLIKHNFVVGEDELQSYNLRKIPDRTGKIRIIEVKDFDFSACGGTHCRASGEVGLIKITRWEKRGSEIRLEFICGRRAWEDYFWKNEMVRNITNKLTIKDTELDDVVNRMLDERKEAVKKIKDLQENLQEYMALDLLHNQAVKEGDLKIINKIFEEESVEEVRRLANRIINLEECILFFGVKGEKANLLFACSNSLNYNMNELIKVALKFVEGRGGGIPNFAQGGGTKITGIEEALNFALVHFKDFILE